MPRATKSPGAPPVRLEEWIKDQRARLGYSQAKLARLLETTEKNVGNGESGRNRPSLPLLLRLHVLFGVPLPYSLDDSPTRVWSNAAA
jgi:transcriptional regulator with XRE-family HTH domain